VTKRVYQRDLKGAQKTKDSKRGLSAPLGREPSLNYIRLPPSAGGQGAGEGGRRDTCRGVIGGEEKEIIRTNKGRRKREEDLLRKFGRARREETPLF